MHVRTHDAKKKTHKNNLTGKEREGDGRGNHEEEIRENLICLVLLLFAASKQTNKHKKINVCCADDAAGCFRVPLSPSMCVLVSCLEQKHGRVSMNNPARTV